MFALFMSAVLLMNPESFASKNEKDAAIEDVKKQMAPILTAIAENKEDMEVAKRAELGINLSKPLGNGRFQKKGFRTAEKKAEAVAQYQTTIKDLESKLDPLEAKIKALKRIPIVTPKPPKKPE